MGSRPLSSDVYVAPMRPYTCPDQLGEGEVATWAPSSSTLISGPSEGILIDALVTFENADQIAAWAKTFGKKIYGVYIGTCATSPPSRRRAARWRTWSTACSNCMASATSRTRYGSRHEPKSLGGHEP